MARDMGHTALAETLWLDLRVGARQILKNRWTMLAVTLSMALGIGSTAAVFNLVEFFVFRSFPVPETQRVVRIAAVSPSNAISSGTAFPVSNRDFEDLRDRSKSFDGVATIAPEQLPGVLLHTGEDQARPVLAALVSGEFFSTLRVQPVIGRSFRPEEDRIGARDSVALISYTLWQREYRGDPGVVGKTIRVNGTTFTVIGVTPQSFYGIYPVVRPELYLPRTMEGLFGNGGTLTDRSSRRLRVVARLKPGITMEQARDDVAGIGAQIERENPNANRGQRLTGYG